MEKFTITFTEDSSLNAYLRACFIAEGIEDVAAETKEGKTCLSVVCPERIFRSVASEGITVFYKTKTIRKNSPALREELLHYAYLGTIVGEGYKQEREDVEKLIPKERDVNADGIFRFLLTEYDKLWKSFAVLSNNLLAASVSDEDVCSLIKYFLGNETTTKRTLILDRTIYFDDTNEDMPCLNVAESEEKTVVFNLLLRRPQEIIIPFPRRYSEELVTLIKKLGE